jgi:hypothetical protein
MTDFEAISAMLTYCRPANSPTEARFIERFLKPLGVRKDKFGNHFLKIGGEEPSILWSSHTDSVHHRDGMQELDFDGTYIKLPEGSASNCLGSDDAAGIWIMTEMIKAKVPGLYVFHYAEEIGCVGSRAIAEKKPSFLKGIKSAVAFDRKGVASVITHQGSRCCSDSFGSSIADQLPKRFELDPTGVLTDTKQYMKIVPECTNISVGYYDEHRPTERLDVRHLIELRNHMVAIDASKFVIERDPTILPPPKLKPVSSLRALRSFRSLLPTDIADLVWTYPRLVARFLEEEVGANFEDLNEYCQNGGVTFSNLFEDEDIDRDEQDDLFAGEAPLRRRA